VNVATVQPPAGAGNVVFVLVPGATVISGLAGPGALTITIPEPP
jgi:hypothetical protein